MAKIHDLAVETLKFAEFAITGVAEGENTGTGVLSCPVTNENQLPTPVIATVTGTYSGTSSGSSAIHTMTVAKDGGATQLFQTARSFGGSTTQNYSFSYSDIDFTPDTSETYTLTNSISTASGGSISSLSSRLRAVYRKF